VKKLGCVVSPEGGSIGNVTRCCSSVEEVVAITGYKPSDAHQVCFQTGKKQAKDYLEQV